MRASWRPLVCAAALIVAAGAGTASAQTVTVISAPPGSVVELAMNTAIVATAKADASGRLTFNVNLFASKKVEQTDVRVWIDICESLRRVVLVEPGLEALPQAGCLRKDVIGVYLLKKNTGMVVDATESSPSVWLRQGAIPNSWLSKDTSPAQAERVWAQSPRGIMPFGGAGILKHSVAEQLGCGVSVDNCDSTTMPITFHVGATFWITPWAGAEVSYLKPLAAPASGSGTGFSYTTELNADILNILGKAGASAGPFRFYGQAGMNYHRLSYATSQVIGPKTLTIDGVSQTLPGGTQDFLLKVDGWGWVWGGGAEIWLKPKFAFYAELGFASLKGQNVNDGEGEIDEIGRSVVGGIKIRIR